jgi:polar amino acid transport system permease protein
VSAPTRPDVGEQEMDAPANDLAPPRIRPWWLHPKAFLGAAIAVVVVAVVVRYGGGGLRFDTDARPEPGTTFDWSYFWALFPDMLRGLWVTVQATIGGFCIAIVLGMFLAIARRSGRRWVSWPTAALIEFVRSTPLLVQLFFLFFALPAWGITLGSMAALIVGLGVHYATYCSEAYRAGINSVPKGQWEAATALNLKGTTTWADVVIPQAIPNVLPALGNYLIAALKDAPLGSSIGVTGILFMAQTAQSRAFDAGVEPFTLIGLGFLAVSIPAAWLIRRLERRISYERTG